MKEKLLSVYRSVKTRIVAFWDKVLGLKKYFTLKTLSWLVPTVIIVVGLVVLFTVPAKDTKDDSSADDTTATVEQALPPASVVGNYGSGLMPAASTPVHNRSSPIMAATTNVMLNRNNTVNLTSLSKSFCFGIQTFMSQS